MLKACKMKLHLQNMLNCNGKLIYGMTLLTLSGNLMLPVLALCLLITEHTNCDSWHSMFSKN